MPLKYHSKNVIKCNPCILKSKTPTFMSVSLIKMKTQHALMMGPIFPFLGVGKGEFFFVFSRGFSSLFLICSQHVPNKFS
jgi:hypothetical protein